MTYNNFVARFSKRTKTTTGFTVRCPAHDDGKASLAVSEGKDGKIILKCFAGCNVLSVVGAMGLKMSDLFANNPTPFKSTNGATPKKQLVTETAVKVKYVIKAIYPYLDALGKEVCQAVRLEPKSFRQRHRNKSFNTDEPPSKENPEWLWTMDGVERVLYQLPEILTAETVWIVEGEKDADNLRALGFRATCNIGGAGKWLDGYTASLAGKHIILCGDNDEPGRKHIDLIFDSVAQKATTVKIVTLPDAFKDVSDFIESTKDEIRAKEFLNEMASIATPHYGGIKMPIYSMADIEPLYYKQVTQARTTCLDLSKWLPSFAAIRPLIPGEVMLIVGDTGVGKTMLLQNIAMSVPNLMTLFFEIELPPELMFERFCAWKLGFDCLRVEDDYKSGAHGEKIMNEQFPNLFICPEPKITLEQLETLILRSDLKLGTKPLLILIDYVQLIRGKGSRYEKTSDIAEGIKTLARLTKTIIVVTSQVTRSNGDTKQIGLHSAKDSGSLENSAGVVVGAWRDEKDSKLLHLKVLKSTKGGGGLEIQCDIDGAKAKVTERIRTAV